MNDLRTSRLWASRTRTCSILCSTETSISREVRSLRIMKIISCSDGLMLSLRNRRTWRSLLTNYDISTLTRSHRALGSDTHRFHSHRVRSGILLGSIFLHSEILCLKSFQGWNDMNLARWFRCLKKRQRDQWRSRLSISSPEMSPWTRSLL